MPPKPPIVLSTDFGLSDGFVGVMHSVIYSISPEARVIDLTHFIEPQDVQQAAFLLFAHWRYFPEGTVFVAVVDPGVGTTRKPIILHTNDDRFIIAPDNGLIDLVIDHYGVKSLIHFTNREFYLSQISTTFHGRDIFSPGAAHLWKIGNPLSFGKPISYRRKLPYYILHVYQGDTAIIEGRIIHIDRFGNAMTNVMWHGNEPPRGYIEVKGKKISFFPSYGYVNPGEPLALVNSEQMIEIAINQGSARFALAISRGERVRIVIVN
ncbi:MAG: SAM-dependent chlorinase/fluorinase [Chlorobi bacterium]|nr:SAM-dependent chlorinase/fluorinase [Chlorobiota bacterium]